MSDEILKGNYNLNNTFKQVDKSLNKEEEIKEKLKNQALASIGGSMVYVERDKLNWDGGKG